MSKQPFISPLEKLRASTNVISDAEYKETFINVSHIASEILSRTLGPYAHTTIIDDGSYRYSTKDGWSIANRIVFNDALANSLFAFIKSISFNLVSRVGDGTTTAIVAADKFITSMDDGPKPTLRQRDYLDLMNSARDKIIKELRSGDYIHYIDPHGDFSDIRNIAYTSTNGNSEIADMIQKIYQETKNPNIYVNIGNDNRTYMEIQTGYRLECIPHMLQEFANTDSREYKTDVGTTFAIFFNHNVTYVIHNEMIRDLLAMLKSSPKYQNATIVLFAPYFDDTISGSINQVNTHYRSNGMESPIMMVQVPMINQIQKHFYNDFRVIVGGSFMEPQTVEMHKRLKDPSKFTEESTENFRNAFDNFGQYSSSREIIDDYLCPLDHCTVGKDFILVESYDTTRKEYQDIYEDAKTAYATELAESSTRMTDLDKEFMNASMRYTRIHGKMGIINVGGSSELERKCLKDSVDDAVLASRSAYENGYVAGMNLALISAIHACIEKSDNEDEKQFLKTLEMSFILTDTEIVQNMLPDKNLNELLEFLKPILNTAIEKHCGYNLVTSEFEDSDHLQVINSVNTDIEILKSVISILGYALTSNQMVSLSRSVDRSVMLQVREAEEDWKYYRIGKNIAKAMKEEDILPMFGVATSESTGDLDGSCYPEDGLVIDMATSKTYRQYHPSQPTSAVYPQEFGDENYQDPIIHF